MKHEFFSQAYKVLFFSFLIAFFAVIASCNKDDDSDFAVLGYDTDNMDAPLLPQGTYESGIRLSSGLMGQYAGLNLEKIRYYIKDMPLTCEIRVYEFSNGNEPGNLLYSKDVRSETSALSWNEHVLDQPIELSGSDLWLAVRYSQQGTQRTMGCDPGPAKYNGDWIWDEADDLWLRLIERSEADINWNLRGYVRLN